MAPNIKFEMSAENAKVIMAVQQIINKQREMEGGQVKFTKATKQSDDMFTAFGKNAASVAAGMLSGAGIISVFKQGLTALEGWDRHLKDMADKTRQIANDLMTFTLIQNPDRMPSASREAVRLGANMNFDASSSLRIAQAAQSMYGTGAAGNKATVGMMQAIQLGVEESDAVNVLAAGKSHDVDPERMLADLYNAGRVSGYTPGMMAKVSPYLSGTDDLGLAMAMMPGFVDRYQKTFPEKFGQAMTTMIKGTAEPLWSKLGVLDGSQEQKIKALSDYMRANNLTEREMQQFLMKNGITEISQNQGLATFAADYESAAARKSQWDADYKPGFISSELATARKNDPKLFADYERGKAEKQLEYEEVFGKTGAKADFQSVQDARFKLKMKEKYGSFIGNVGDVGIFNRFFGQGAGGTYGDDELSLLRVKEGLTDENSRKNIERRVAQRLYFAGVQDPELKNRGASETLDMDRIDTLIRLIRQVERNTSTRSTAAEVSE